MKTSASKNSDASNSHPSKHFFNKSGESAFFSQPQMDETPFFAPTTIQTKLTIGQPGDKYEQEADSMAVKVVQNLGSTKSPPPIQKCGTDEQEDQVQKKEESTEEFQLSKKPIFESSEPPPEDRIQTKSSQPQNANLESQLNSSKGSGSPLSEDVQSKMEQGFGVGFENVNIHTNSQAVQMNQDVGAQAFTHGNDIYFNQGKYAPNSQNGMKLLAHELTHVVQQNAAGPPKVSTSLDPEELSGPQLTTSPGIQRLVCDTPPVVTTTPGRNFMFDQSSSGLTGSHLFSLILFYTGWYASGGIDQIIIDGYASTEGAPGDNRSLSCDRAETIKGGLLSLGVPLDLITTRAMGETAAFSTASLPSNRRVVLHTVAVPRPTVSILPLFLNRIPPGKTRSMLVAASGVPAGRNITLEVIGGGGGNGTATVAPATITGVSLATLTGGVQTAPTNANNLQLRARINGLILDTSSGFTVAAHPRDATMTFRSDINTALLGLSANFNYSSDGTGTVAELDETEISEQVDLGSRDNPPFTSIGAITTTTGTSGFFPGDGTGFFDTHTYLKSNIRHLWLLRLLGSKPIYKIQYTQLFIFNDHRTGVTNQVLPNSGFTITHYVWYDKSASKWWHMTIKVGAATTLFGFSATAGTGTSISSLHGL